jgi:tRNA C32,U32 (ribose-2'-O)-methylase TrmJ
LDDLPDSLPSNLISVLASPSHPGNIGAVARSLKTMGLASCRLVSPDDYPSPIASARASGALDVLNDASVYETFDDAIADCRLVVGTSARLRSLTYPHVTPRVKTERFKLKGQKDEPSSARIVHRDGLAVAPKTTLSGG